MALDSETPIFDVEDEEESIVEETIGLSLRDDLEQVTVVGKEVAISAPQVGNSRKAGKEIYNMSI